MYDDSEETFYERNTLTLAVIVVVLGLGGYAFLHLSDWLQHFQQAISLAVK